MRVCVVWGVVLAVLSFNPNRAAANGAMSPLGTWQTTLVGADRGVVYLTFTNDFTFSGYGFTRDSFGLFNIAGTWGNNSAVHVVGGYTQDFGEDSEAGSFDAKLNGRGTKLVAFARASNGRLRFLGTAGDATIADLRGNWTSQVTVEGRRHFETYTIDVSTNLAGVFEVSGQGDDAGGSFTVSGALIINSRGQVAGYTINDYTTSVKTNSFTGRVSGNARRLTLRGHRSDGRDITIRAQQ